MAQTLIASERTIVCWAMGLTQHRHAVATIQRCANVLLMRGMIGKPGAGVCPVRGHSNVQGDRTMGIWEKMPEAFLAALDAEFGITSPARSTASTPSTRSGRCATAGAKVFIGDGRQLRFAPPPTPPSPRPRCAVAR